jgi:hypothetical protein
MRSPQKIEQDEWVDAETACAMLGGIAPRTLRHMAAEHMITRDILPGPTQTRVYFKPDIERILKQRAPRPVARQKAGDQQALVMLFELLTQLTQMRPTDPRRPLHLSLEEAAAYAGLPAPFLLRLVAERKLACWKTEGPSESGAGYFFARADLEELRPAVEEAG